MAELKTRKNEGDVEGFLNSIENDRRRQDGYALLQMMSEVTGEEPKMWGDSMVGFGEYHYKYESGREGDFFVVGFAPRKQALSLYLMSGFDAYDDLLARLGKHKTGKACLYVNKLADVDEAVLRELIAQSYQHTKEAHA